MSNSKIGEKPLIVITHSMGTLVFKKILKYAAQGDPRLKSLKENLKGVIFIAGPNNGISFTDYFKQNIKGFLGQTVRFDAWGGVGISQDEVLDHIIATMYHTKATYYMAKRNHKNLEKLQSNFDEMKIKAITLSEGQPIKFGPFNYLTYVVKKSEAIMKGYPNVNLPDKNHSETNKVKDKNDPTFIAISKFIDESFG